MLWVKRIGILLLLLILGVTALAVYTVRNSFPQVRGELEVGGLRQPVEILRDELGVPHLYATNSYDLFFAQGYTHAQDRFFQMDFWRHIGSGRLSEMFGNSQVDTDMFLRSLGWERLAQEEWATAEGPGREVLAAYADGVNAYLETNDGPEVSLEYAILGLQNSEYEIEPWSPIHSLTWAKVMSWDLSGNMRSEIARAVLGRTLSPDQVEQLFPTFPADKPVIVESDQRVHSAAKTVAVPEGAIRPLVDAGRAAHELWEITGGGFEGIGSNNWVVSGELTASGMPLLANDTHLAPQMPSIWYENGLHCTGDAEDCPYQLVGFTFAGVPGVVIGHNGHHAWGVTSQAADTQDLYIERVNPDNPDQYRADGEWVEFETREETIVVAGGEDVTYEVLATRHGPVISEIFLEEGQFDGSSTLDLPDEYVVALSWQSLEPSTLLEAIVEINLAKNYDQFRTAVSKWDIATQNIVYADVEGNIAYHSTGEIPIRSQGDGRYPVPGWNSDYEWTGLVPFEDMPSVFNPETGYISSANQLVLRPGSEPLIGTDSAYGYRAERIDGLIEAGPDHDIASMQALQFDSRDGGAEVVMPYLLDLDVSDDDDLSDLQTRLQGWSEGNNALSSDGRSNGAAIYQAVWRQLLAETFQDDLPEDYWPDGGSRWFEVVRGLLQDPGDPFWDDKRTAEVEGRDQILRSAMKLAHAELSELLGEDVGSWKWGDLHIAKFENQSLGQSGIAPVEWLFNRTAPNRVGGSSSIVNAVGWSTDASYDVDWVPSQRMVIDLGDLDSSTFIHTTGQSGHAFSANYDSMIEMWTDGEHGPMPFSRAAVESVSVDLLTLVPAG